MKKVWFRFLLLTLMLMLFGCSEGDIETESKSQNQTETEEAPEALSESERLTIWLDQKYEEQLEFSPISLTYQGSKKLYDQIDDFSQEAREEQFRWQTNSLEEMQALFNYELLDNTGKTSYDLWKYQATQAIDGWKFRDHDYIFEQMDGAHTSLPTFLLGFHPVESGEDFAAYISRIAAIGRAIEQLTERSREAALEGIRPPRFSYEFVIKESTDLITGAPFQMADTDVADSPVWADANTKIDQLLNSSAIDEEQAEVFRQQAREGLLNIFEPAYLALIEFIQEDMNRVSESPQGVSELPDGIAYYEYMLRAHTTTSLSVEEVHHIGLKEVARLKQEMVQVMEATGYEGNLSDFFTLIRESITDERFYYPDTDEGRLSYITDATQAIENIKAQLPNYFGILPKADLVVKRVEAFREQPGAAQHYYPGTPDGSRPGIYYAHLSDMTTMPKNQLEVIAYHEGLPGHHMQIAIAQEKTDLPKFRRQGWHTAYGEGWALYSELLAKEIPQTYTDHYSDFGRLSSEIWRAIRLVVDTGLHAMGWTEQQAIEYFSENSPEPLEGIRSEVRRYLVLPGQATSYKIGMLKILELREKAETVLGDSFDIKAFHDQILGGGSLPLALLETHIDRWIETQLTDS